MIKFHTLLLAACLALSSTVAIADNDTKSVVRMVILGTSSGGDGFVTSAISVSAGVGNAVMGGYVADAYSGSIGTAAVAGATEDGISGSLVGFTKSYETSVCIGGTCPGGTGN